jgi:hypothetical protein
MEKEKVENPVYEALLAITGKTPPTFVKGKFSLNGLKDKENEELQEWCMNNARPMWSTGFSNHGGGMTIDATDEARTYLINLFHPQWRNYIKTRLAGDFAYMLAKEIEKKNGILHTALKVVYTFLQDIPGKRKQASGKCKAGNEGCQKNNKSYSAPKQAQTKRR